MYLPVGSYFAEPARVTAAPGFVSKLLLNVPALSGTRAEAAMSMATTPSARTRLLGFPSFFFFFILNTDFHFCPLGNGNATYDVIRHGKRLSSMVSQTFDNEAREVKFFVAKSSTSER